MSSKGLEAVLLKRGAYEHAARASECAPMVIHSLERRACITQAAIVDLGTFLAAGEAVRPAAPALRLTIPRPQNH